MDPIKRVIVEVTPDSVWFLERYLSVFDFLEIFPADAIGTNADRGLPVRFRTDLDFDLETDIDRASMQLRNRSKHRGWMRWTTERQLRAGDRIVIEQTGIRDYRLSLLRPEPELHLS